MSEATALRCEAVRASGTRMSPDQVAAWSSNIGNTVGAIVEQAAGLLHTVVVDAGMLDWLRAHRDDGNPVGAMVLALVEAVLHAREQNDPAAVTCCGKCARPIPDNTFRLVCVLPDDPAPCTGLVVAICGGCGSDWAEARVAGVAVVAPLFGGIRVLAEAGHA